MVFCSCFGLPRKRTCRIFGGIDIVMSTLSFFLWISLFMEATEFKDHEWKFSSMVNESYSAIPWKCGQHYFEIYRPKDVGIQLEKSVVFYMLSSVGYLVTGLFLIYATLSAPESSIVLLSSYLFCQAILVIMSIVSSILISSEVLCFLQHDRVPSHEGRQDVIVALTMIFLFAYKSYELLQVVLYLREVSKIPHDRDHPLEPYPYDVEMHKQHPLIIKAAQLSNPPVSRVNSQQDLNMNNTQKETKKSKKMEYSDSSNSEEDENMNELKDKEINDNDKKDFKEFVYESKNVHLSSSVLTTPLFPTLLVQTTSGQRIRVPSAYYSPYTNGSASQY